MTNQNIRSAADDAFIGLVHAAMDCVWDECDPRFPDHPHPWELLGEMLSRDIASVGLELKSLAYTSQQVVFALTGNNGHGPFKYTATVKVDSDIAFSEDDDVVISLFYYDGSMQLDADYRRGKTNAATFTPIRDKFLEAREIIEAVA